MRYYKPKKYKTLPADVYRRAIDAVRAYPRLEEEVANMIDERHAPDVPVKNKEPSNPTASIAERREKKLKEIAIIDKALNTIPVEYQNMIYENIVDLKPMANIEGVSRATLTRYRMKVIVEVAHSTGLIDDAEYEGIRKAEFKR